MTRKPAPDRKLLTLLCSVVLLGGSAVSIAGPAVAGVPADATRVAVTSGATTPEIDGHLHRGGSISGTVTSALTGKVLSSEVDVYDGNGRIAGISLIGGHYFIGSLPASATGYVVCAHGADDPKDTRAPRGYVGRCYSSAAWDDKTVPASAKRVALAAGQQRTGIDIALNQQSAAIGGYLTAPNGSSVSGTVTVRSLSTGVVYPTGVVSTSFTGHYVVRDLPASPRGYVVCARPENFQLYAPRCWHDVTWSGVNGPLPKAATPVSVKLGVTHSRVSIAFPREGAISGTIRDAVSGRPLAGMTVDIFDSVGRRVTGGFSDSHGNYRAATVPPMSGYRVCVEPADPTLAVHYNGSCWIGHRWDGGRTLPSHLSTVTVHSLQTRTGVNFRLGRITYSHGIISGTITDQATGKPLAAGITVFQDGRQVTLNGMRFGVTTDAAGQYRIALRPSATGYVICADRTGSAGQPGAPALGYAPRCYSTASWYGWMRVGGEGAEPEPPPAGANTVPLAARQTRNGIDIALPAAGGITGKATVFGTGTPVQGIEVDLYTATGGRFDETFTAADGTYSFTELAPQASSATTGYVVCFNGHSGTTAGYLSQCYDQVAGAT